MHRVVLLVLPLALPLVASAACGISPVKSQTDEGSRAAEAGTTTSNTDVDGGRSDAGNDGSTSDLSQDVHAELELFGTIGTSLVRIDTTTGAATYVGTTNVQTIAKLAYHAGNGMLYGILDYLNIPKLVAVDACTGSTMLVAPLKVAGTEGPVYFVGGFDYNPTDGKLYASVSLDGAYPLDSTEEHLVTVDPMTGLVTSVGEIRDGVGLVDADVLAFSSAAKLVVDVDPHDGGLHTIWDLDTADAAATNVRITADVISWIEFHKGVFYGTIHAGALARNLVTIDPSTGALTKIGPTHGPNDFGGGPIQALSEGVCVRALGLGG